MLLRRGVRSCFDEFMLNPNAFEEIDAGRLGRPDTYDRSCFNLAEVKEGVVLYAYTSLSVSDDVMAVKKTPTLWAPSTRRTPTSSASGSSVHSVAW